MLRLLIYILAHWHINTLFTHMKKEIITILLLSFLAVVYSQDMQLIKGGSYNYKLNVGSAKKVLIKDIYVDKHEVTIKEFMEFVKATGYKSDAQKKGYSIAIKNYGQLGVDTLWGADWRCDSRGVVRNKECYNYPVMHVSYNDAIAFAKWKGKRLLTEEEWMYVASAKSSGKLEDRLWCLENSKRADKAWDAHAVGTKEPNVLGVYDIFGNVEEFVFHDTKQDIPYLAKGGCFWDFLESYKTMLGRQMCVMHPDYTSDRFGIRCAKDVK